MGLSAIVSSASASSDSVTTMFSPVGAGVGGLFVVIALIVLLAYYDILSSAEVDDQRAETHAEIKRTLVVTIIPLLFAFGGVVTFTALGVL